MTILREYIKPVDYFICPEGKTPKNNYQAYDNIVFCSKITEQDADTYKDKVIYIFFTDVDKDVMLKLCEVAKSIYFVNRSYPKYIDFVSNLSYKDNFHSFLTNCDVDDYINFVNNLN